MIYLMRNDRMARQKVHVDWFEDNKSKYQTEQNCYQISYERKNEKVQKTRWNMEAI